MRAGEWLGRIRAYFKLDLYFFEHPKVIDLSHSATVLYVASIAYANRRETDGFIARPVLRRLIEVDWQDSNAPSHEDLAGELVRAGLWVEVPPRPGSVRPDTEPRPPDGPGGWRIHDFLDHNDSNEDRAKRRADDAARKQRERGGKGGEPAGQEPAKGRPVNVHPDRNGRPAGPETPSEPVRAIAVTEQSTNRAEQNGSSTTIVEQARPGDVDRAVFDAWVDSFPDPTRRDFTPARRDAIRAALKCYPLADVVDAARGWVNDAWEDRPQQNDLAQLLHMGSKRKPQNVLEKMRDLWRNGPPQVPGKATLRMVRNAQGMRAWAEQMEGGGDGTERVGTSRPTAQRQLPGPAT
jgi:hypothetical protein